MKIQDVQFVGSFGFPGKLPRDPRPEVALFGRSNVGKSSLINTILGRRGVARISKTPGKTRSANFFMINDRFFLVDMPGYGFARASKSEISRWDKIYAQYLSDTTRNNALIQLVDMRHDPTPADVDNTARMADTGHPLCIVFNKSDKVGRPLAERRIRDSLAILEAPPQTAVIPFSSVTGTGKNELWGWITDSLSL
jgi:GTP-binding protein